MLKQHTPFSAALSALRLSGVALACAASLTSVHSVQAATLASGQASLTGIRYELIDLAPDDGETPWIRFENDDGTALSGLADATGLSHLDNVAQTAGWQGLLPAQAVQAQSLDGLSTAQAGPDSLSTSFSVDASVLNQMQPLGDGSGRSRLDVFSQVRTGNGIASLAYDIDEATGRVTALDGETGWRPLDFTLSAHTALVIHADASAQVSIDPSQGSWDIRHPGGNTADEPMIGSGVQIALLMLRPGFTMQPSYASFDDFYADMDQAYELSFDGLSADWTPDDLATMTPSSRSLQVMLSNDSSLQTRGNLLMTGMSQFAVSQTAVPEPASWALMALGLIGGLAARAGQRRQRQRTTAA